MDPHPDYTDPIAAFTALGLPPPDEAGCAAWRESQRTYPGEPLPFLTRNYMEDACRTLRMSPEVSDAVLAGLTDYVGHPELSRFAWHWYSRMEWAGFGEESDGVKSRPLPHWPSPPKVGGANGHVAAMLYVHVLLARLPAVREFHRRRGVSEVISLDTFTDLELWMRENKRLFGQWGLFRPDWNQIHFAGRLFRIGRLQFENHAAWFPFNVYRRREPNEHGHRPVVMLADSEYSIRADGQFDSADGGATPGEFMTRFTQTATNVSGNPVSPLGAIRRELIELELSEWELVFKNGDPCLGIHIAASGPMEHAACGDSVRRAVPFYRELFPDRPFKALTCGSWLLDPQLEKHLPAASNIVRFLSEFYLHPKPKANSDQTYERVFDDPHADLATAPQKTSLQRMVVEHVKAGGRWRGGGGLILPEDVGRWGEKCYR